jgi:hypothetical protein
MIKLRYETVPYNHPHGAWNPTNMRRDMDEAFSGKPEKELEYLIHKIEEVEAKIRVEKLRT